MKDKKKLRLTFDSDNLAVPEVHTNEDNVKDNTELEETGIVYDNLAMPEIIIKPKNKTENR